MLNTLLARAKLPRDANSEPIPVMAPAASARITTVGVSSSRVALPGNTSAGTVVRVAVTQDCYIAFGDSSVDATANDVLMTPGVEYFKIPDGASNIAAIRAADDGTLTITEMT